MSDISAQVIQVGAVESDCRSQEAILAPLIRKESTDSVNFESRIAQTKMHRFAHAM